MYSNFALVIFRDGEADDGVDGESGGEAITGEDM
jgi:hypothetical protein